MSTKGEEMYQDIVKLVTYECPQANVDIIQRKVMDALRYMARETCLLQTSLFPAIESGIADYDLEEIQPEGYSICEVLWVKWCGCCIHPVDECDPCPCGYSMVSDDCITIHPTPSGNKINDLEVKVAMQPDYSVCHIAKPFVKHYELIKDITTAMMLDMNKKPWTDKRSASSMKRTNSALINELSSKVNRGLAPSNPKHLLSSAV